MIGRRARTTPSRFVVARMRRGLQCWQVADALDFSRRRMWAIEHGRALATDDEVEAIMERQRKMEQAQQQMMAMREGAATAKDLSQTPVDGNTALARLIGY